jgi:DNA modification methylase
VTSPPYFGLRDYGNAEQIGLEPTPDAYVQALVEVFREVRRVLKSCGTVWLNIGDSYAAGGKGGGGSFMAERREAAWQKRSTLNGWRRQPEGCKEKDLLGIPWRVAFALRADGWYLRSDIIWSKPNPMPESVTDRPTKAHEYLFLLSKNERYYYDADAIAEPLPEVSVRRYEHAVRTNERFDPKRHKHTDGVQSLMEVLTRAAAGVLEKGTRNKRSVWHVNTSPYAGAHFATMPEKLIEPCILAGCPLGGLVLDPFVGSGTVVAVAQRLGRRGVGVDLSYQDLAKERTAQRGIPFTDERTA